MLKPVKMFLSTPRYKKRGLSIAYDFLAIWLSLYAAYALRLDKPILDLSLEQYTTFACTVFVTLAVFVKLGMYRAVLRYITVPALANIFLGVLVSSLAVPVFGFLFQAFVPRSVPAIYAGLAILALGGPRILLRAFYYHQWKRKKPNVLIYGAGATGRDLAYALQQGNEYHPVAFLDDDPGKRGTILLGLKVHKFGDFDKLLTHYQPVKILLAINNIDKADRIKLVEKLTALPLEVQSVPSLDDLASGKAKISELRDLDVAELLGRKPVQPIDSLLARCIKNRSVMVTGAGGSIGSELCRQIIKQQPDRLVLFELNEYNLYKIERELKQTKLTLGFNTSIISILGSVQDKTLVQLVTEQHKVKTIYHAAAFKHVPLVEANIIEGVRNNVLGTWFCAEAAIESGVQDFVLISTDKAVRPTNVMGASKRLAELVLQSLSDRQDTTCFSMVRFGNVLDSSGSVVPLFRDQIRKGGPVTVTHPDITRYFMMIPEAAELVIQAGSMRKNGQVFVLDMGEPVKILDLARKMIHLMGMKEVVMDTNDGKECNSEDEIEIVFTGLRPGEKLFEELLVGDNVEGTIHPKIMTACEDKLSWGEMQRLLEYIQKLSDKYDDDSMIRLLKEAPLSFAPTVDDSKLIQLSKKRSEYSASKRRNLL
ncbi:polysaccharide biosynthesis protein [Grimontia hollisae]|uniref:Mannosyl-transferase n=2 Tax=Grimontia hollisae TaxID=673 RepID=D0IC17_GRIHO|nr:nucleoside-diphosphate sugar epimerase/dehydratase [Grimontia hollisae]AMG29807.1 polysaccharide biosynthesis protein [Grimontia hollisae]EEY71435.1 mannosyl-transferase [Grimontia hollisae CIP 101886]STO43297.1 UDP-glucose 4-epimerase [Grimontia hollisae]STO56890.1 UDP-glucose 4-epimerase [Grimontia hollisae]STQ74747.1 UDP-glucose 4-epimerase [Grimontia hollisae]